MDLWGMVVKVAIVIVIAPTTALYIGDLVGGSGKTLQILAV